MDVVPVLDRACVPRELHDSLRPGMKRVVQSLDHVVSRPPPESALSYLPWASQKAGITMMSPFNTSWPPNFLTPSLFPALSFLLLVELDMVFVAKFYARGG